MAWLEAFESLPVAVGHFIVPGFFRLLGLPSRRRFDAEQEHVRIVSMKKLQAM